MKILIGTGASEPERCTSKCFIREARKLGHDVFVAGPSYNTGKETNALPADLSLIDKPYPETYTYKEILDKCPWTPDVILQIEPHFYFVGERPKEIRSYYWAIDIHRGGMGHRDMAIQGNFDGVFLGHHFFAPSYRNMRTYWLPQALDVERIQYNPNIDPECDIAFIGETGIHPDLLVYNKTDAEGFEYLDELPSPILLRSEYREYAERAQLIGYLIDDFDVRIYESNSQRSIDHYARIIHKGEIGFNRSLMNDVAMRIFEVIGCNRPLVTDDVPEMSSLYLDEDCYIYKQFGYDPFLPNFKLNYEQARWKVEEALNNVDRFEKSERAMEFVLKNHTFKNRVERFVEVASS